MGETEAQTLLPVLLNVFHPLLKAVARELATGLATSPPPLLPLSLPPVDSSGAAEAVQGEPSPPVHHRRLLRLGSDAGLNKKICNTTPEQALEREGGTGSGEEHLATTSAARAALNTTAVAAEIAVPASSHGQIDTLRVSSAVVHESTAAFSEALLTDGAFAEWLQTSLPDDDTATAAVVPSLLLVTASDASMGAVMPTGVLRRARLLAKVLTQFAAFAPPDVVELYCSGADASAKAIFLRFASGAVRLVAVQAAKLLGPLLGESWPSEASGLLSSPAPNDEEDISLADAPALPFSELQRLVRLQQRDGPKPLPDSLSDLPSLLPAPALRQLAEAEVQEAWTTITASTAAEAAVPLTTSEEAVTLPTVSPPLSSSSSAVVAATSLVRQLCLGSAQYALSIGASPTSGRAAAAPDATSAERWSDEAHALALRGLSLHYSPLYGFVSKASLERPADGDGDGVEEDGEDGEDAEERIMYSGGVGRAGVTILRPMELVATPPSPLLYLRESLRSKRRREAEGDGDDASLERQRSDALSRRPSPRIGWLPLQTDGSIGDSAPILHFSDLVRERIATRETAATTTTAPQRRLALRGSSQPPCPLSPTTAAAIEEVGEVLWHVNGIFSGRTLLDESAWSYGRNNVSVAAVSTVELRCEKPNSSETEKPPIASTKLGDPTRKAAPTTASGESISVTGCVDTVDGRFRLGYFMHETGLFYASAAASGSASDGVYVMEELADADEEV